MIVSDEAIILFPDTAHELLLYRILLPEWISRWISIQSHIIEYCNFVIACFI